MAVVSAAFVAMIRRCLVVVMTEVVAEPFAVKVVVFGMVGFVFHHLFLVVVAFVVIATVVEAVFKAGVAAAVADKKAFIGVGSVHRPDHQYHQQCT